MEQLFNNFYMQLIISVLMPIILFTISVGLYYISLLANQKLNGILKFYVISITYYFQRQISKVGKAKGIVPDDKEDLYAQFDKELTIEDINEHVEKTNKTITGITEMSAKELNEIKDKK